VLKEDHLHNGNILFQSPDNWGTAFISFALNAKPMQSDKTNRLGSIGTNHVPQEN
jgi:hypothetical protein